MKKGVLTAILVSILATSVSGQVSNADRPLIRPEPIRLRQAILRYELLRRRALRENREMPPERRKHQKTKRQQRRLVLRSLRRWP